jgi:hypothetical protein
MTYESKSKGAGKHGLLGYLCALLILSLGTAATLPAQTTPAAAAPALPYQPWTGDFDGMLQRRFIRVLVSYSKTQYYVVKGVQHGSSYEYFKEFENWVNLKYPPKVKNTRFHVLFIPVPRDQMLSRLGAGRADLAVGTLTITPERLKVVDFSDPLVTGVKEIAVTGPHSPAVHSTGQSGVVTRGANGTVAHGSNGTYVGHDGNVYRKDSTGNWSQYNNGSWNHVDTSNAQAQAQQRAQSASQNRTQAENLGGSSRQAATQNHVNVQPNVVNELNQSAQSRQRGQMETQRFQSFHRGGGGRFRR